jgi:hypothetical protein
MSEIVLVAFNARYAHSALGSRYLMANLGELKAKTLLLEFDILVHPRIAAEQILKKNPSIIGIGCYIWNIDLVTRVAKLIKAISPEIKIILGGPEISYETEAQEIFDYADYVICGEGEVEFKQLCQGLLSQEPNLIRIINASPVNLEEIELPYEFYNDEDIKNRAIYVETSRGCPFSCEYCMSSLDSTVRDFPSEKLFTAFDELLKRGALIFKFVDRSFNLDIPFAIKIITFFRERYKSGMMLHFEMIPEKLPEELMEVIKSSPAEMLQFEIGIQTFNEVVARTIKRPLDIHKIESNMRKLRHETTVHIHADLIAGLPGEDSDSFENGFNKLLALNPQEIQLGILKRLRGAPIDRHSSEYKMIYSPHAPYEILQTHQISFFDMQRISRFARYWNITVNNGRFIHTAPLIWQDTPSAFASFMKWSDWLYEKTNKTGNIALLRLAKLLMEYLTTQANLQEKQAAESIWKDYCKGNRLTIPGFLKKFGLSLPAATTKDKSNPILQRQSRHQIH